MRYTIPSVIIILLFFAGIISGEDISETPIDYFGENKKPQKIDPYKKKKEEYKSQQDQIQKNMQSRIPGRAKLYVFLKPGGRYSKSAVKEAVRFKKLHPDIEIQGVLIAAPEPREIARMKDVFTSGIEFVIDSDLRLMEQYKIDKAPSFVISMGSDSFKIAGQPDLEEFYKKCINYRR